MSFLPPRILIPIPTSFDTPYNEQSWPEYAAAVKRFGGIPMRVPLMHTPAELERMVGDAQGILLPGSGADVNPASYGHGRNPASAPADSGREATDFALLTAAERAGVPVLAICFGMQSLNVFRGGTLIQDLSPLPVNHRAGRSVSAAHAVSVVTGSGLHGILGAFTGAGGEDCRLTVNSSHHQAVAIIGENLVIVARSAEDDVVEAIESTDDSNWMYGVQWHPERTLHTSEASQAIFRAFIGAANAGNSQ